MHNWDKLTRVTNIRACVRKGLRLRPLEKQGGRRGGGFKKFLLCNLFWFRRVCMFFFFFLIISFLFLAYFFFCCSGCFLLFHAFLFLFVCLFLYGFILFRYKSVCKFFLWCPIVAGVGSVAKVTAQPGSNSSWYVPCIIYKVLVLTKVERNHWLNGTSVYCFSRQVEFFGIWFDLL